MPWVRWRGAAAKKKAREAGMQALLRTGRVIMEASKRQVPLDDSALQDSGKVKRSRAKAVTVRLVYGGKAAPYAVKWHERPAKFKRGRKRRYLADPFNLLAYRTLRREIRRSWRQRFSR